MKRWWGKPELCSITKKKHKQVLEANQKAIDQFNKVAVELERLLKPHETEPTD